MNISVNENKKSNIEKQEKVNIAIPIAVANWLVINTSLTFDQIADFCSIHPAIIQNLSNKDNKTSVLPSSPINIYLTDEEIQRCSKNKNARLRPIKSPIQEMGIIKPKTKAYISVSKKRNRMDAAMWMYTFYPEINSSTIARLVKSTTKTINKIKDGTYSGLDKLIPKNPIVLGLCSKEDLENATKRFSVNKDNISENNESI